VPAFEARALLPPQRLHDLQRFIKLLDPDACGEEVVLVGQIFFLQVIDDPGRGVGALDGVKSSVHIRMYRFRC